MHEHSKREAVSSQGLAQEKSNLAFLTPELWENKSPFCKWPGLWHFFTGALPDLHTWVKAWKCSWKLLQRYLHLWHCTSRTWLQGVTALADICLVVLFSDPLFYHRTCYQRWRSHCHYSRLPFWTPVLLPQGRQTSAGIWELILLNFRWSQWASWPPAALYYPEPKTGDVPHSGRAWEWDLRLYP
jgi:hypothetical protein